MENLPVYISVFFGLTTLVSIALFWKATHYSKSFLAILLFWIGIQTALSLSGFYKVNSTLPPRFTLALLPIIVLIIVTFLSKRGRTFMDSLDGKTLTIFSVIRIPVEIVLFLLFTHKAIPELITFEGRNFDILSGITAPIIYYFGFVKKRLNKTILLIWNFVCLGLLLNVVFYALLSIPSPIQQFAFDQPNIAVAYFPFILLPSCLVPMVLFSHLVVIRQLLTSKLYF
ncbi:MAG: hypothetical protein V4648_02130 [Bacteroidota bacterium]